MVPKVGDLFPKVVLNMNQRKSFKIIVIRAYYTIYTLRQQTKTSNKELKKSQ